MPMKENNYVVIDFDNTIADTTRSIIEMLSEKTNREILYEPSVVQWNFKPYIQNEEEWKFCMSCFESEEMYKRAKIIDETNLRNFLDSTEYQTILCSCRRPKTYDYCLNYIKQNKLNFDHVVFTNSFDKSMIAPGQNSVIVDDKTECLSGDRGARILFGNYGYQNKTSEAEWHTHKASNWKNVKNIIDNSMIRYEKDNVQ